MESVDKPLRAFLGEQSKLQLIKESRYHGVAPPTADRWLDMLQCRGSLRRHWNDRTYVPGPTLLGLGFKVLRQLHLRTHAPPVLGRFNDDTEETIHLGRLGDQVHFIDVLRSAQALLAPDQLRHFLPAHLPSTGKALLADLWDPELLRLHVEEDTVQVTEEWTMTRMAFRQALA